MQMDFHYSVIKILASKAGFNAQQAQIIAYASQYVDDATLHKPIPITAPPHFLQGHPRYNATKQLFDPICTAHKGLGMIQGLRPIAQKKVYVCFHFIPQRALPITNPLHYITTPGNAVQNSLAHRLVQKAIQATHQDPDQRLVQLGIALHSYADTWAHQGFCGIRSTFNDIKGLQYKNKNTWRSAFYGYLPDIGHAEATHWPDTMHAQWKYSYQKAIPNVLGASSSYSIPTIRQNSKVFIQAAQQIFLLLCQAAGNPHALTIWEQIELPLLRCMEYNSHYDSALRQYIFAKYFPGIPLAYNPNYWKEQALSQNSVLWYYFHLQAYEQRLLIFQN
jgi:hypothetical protein